MLACEIGAIDILIHLLDSLFVNVNTIDKRDFLFSVHFKLENKESETAISLLSAFYNKDILKFKEEFLMKAMKNKFYLLELVM